MRWFNRTVWPYLWWAWQVFLFFLPHVVTEDVAVQRRPDGDYDMVCAMSALFEDEELDGVVTVTSLAFMFWSFPLSSPDDEIRPWPKAIPNGDG